MRSVSLFAAAGVLLLLSTRVVRADLLGYWSANSSAGQGTLLVNDQGNADLDGEIFGAEFTGDGEGHTGLPGDYAVSFPGEDDDYVVIPPTEETFEEITITTWVNGLQVAAWAGLVVSRAPGQPIGLDFHNFEGMVNYIWNDDSADTWNFMSDVLIPEDEWTFVALTIDPDQATLYAGPKGGELEFAVNEIPHFPQDNFTEWRWAEDDGFAGARNFSGLMDDVSIWNEALTLDDIAALHAGTVTPLTLRGGGLPGDFDGNQELNAADINLLTQRVIDGTFDPAFDVNSDGVLSDADRTVWVDELKATYFGDANLDGEFNSGDFVQVFQAGQYEDATAGNSLWETGDWDGDLEFSSSDFVKAFQSGGFEQGPRMAVAVVPEPGGVLLVCLGWLAIACRRQ